MALKTDFKDDIFEGNRKYKLSQDGTGNTEIQDVTVYSQEGDLFTAEHINATNEAVNGLSEDMVDLKKSVSDGKAQVAAAITAKRVPTAATATFGEMAANIGKIVLGSGNAVPSDVLAGKTFTNNDGVEYTGTMPNRGDYNGWGNSKGNDADNQRMWVKIPQGYYNENANVFLSWADIRNMAGITADKIKKNEPIMGIIGSFEGWVPTPQDLYYNGVNVGGLQINLFAQENTRLLMKGDYSTWNHRAIVFPNTIDVRSYSKLIFEGQFLRYWKNDPDNGIPPSWISLCRYKTYNSDEEIAKVKWDGGYGASIGNFQLDISQLTTFEANKYYISIGYIAKGTYITRIRLE